MKLFRFYKLRYLIFLLAFYFSGAGAAELVFPQVKSCGDDSNAISSCSVVLDKDGYIVDAHSGRKLFDKPEPMGALSSNKLYQYGSQYILENQNYSSSKTRRWVAFSYDDKRIVLNRIYIFSLDIFMPSGPRWHGYECHPDSAELTARANLAFGEVAIESLCGDVEANVVTVANDIPTPLAADTLAVSVPVYVDRQRRGGATYLFMESDEPDLAKMVCYSNCRQLSKNQPVLNLEKTSENRSKSSEPTLIKKISANLLGDASRQNVFVLTTESDAAYHRLLIAPEQQTGDQIILDTSKALPLIKTQYSSAVNDGFSVSVINGQSGTLKVIDQQAEPVSVKQSSGEAGDYIALVTNEEDNGIYNFNLLFRYSKSSKKFELKNVLQVTNSASCDRSILSVEELPKEMVGEVSLESFDGLKVFEQLHGVHAGTPSDGYKKLMMIDTATQLDQALALYRKGDTRAFNEVMGYFLMGGESDRCDPQSYIVRKYYFAQMPGWSNDLGFLLGEAGYYAESIELLKAVVANNPGRVVAYLNLADSYWGANDKERAAVAYKQYGLLMSGAGKALKVPTRVVERSNGAVEL